MKAKMRKKKVDQVGKTRCNIRWPADLDNFARGYAAENNTTITQLIVDHFTGLQKTNGRKQT